MKCGEASFFSFFGLFDRVVENDWRGNGNHHDAHMYIITSEARELVNRSNRINKMKSGKEKQRYIQIESTTLKAPNLKYSNFGYVRFVSLPPDGQKPSVELTIFFSRSYNSLPRSFNHRQTSMMMSWPEFDGRIGIVKLSIHRDSLTNQEVLESFWLLKNKRA